MFIITGSIGLIGSSAAEFFLKKNIKIIGIDNDLRTYFFGKVGSNKWKEKKLKNMIAALEKGAKVKTVGGLYGTVTGVKDDRFVLRIAENVKIEVAKEAVAAKVD